jgi:hypothetical protein
VPVGNQDAATDDVVLEVAVLVGVAVLVEVAVLVDVAVEVDVEVVDELDADVAVDVDVDVDVEELDDDLWCVVPHFVDAFGAASELCGTAETPTTATAMPAAVMIGTRVVRRTSMSSHRRRGQTG